MTKQPGHKDSKNLIIGICAAIATIIVIIVAIVVGNRGPVLNDDYFVSDDTKYTFTMVNSVDETSGEILPIKTHLVYFYSGDKITGVKTYYEFKDADDAKKAYETLKESDEDISGTSIDGKYIIATANASDYENITASEVKQQIELMQNLQNSDTDETIIENE